MSISVSLYCRLLAYRIILQFDFLYFDSLQYFQTIFSMLKRDIQQCSFANINTNQNNLEAFFYVFLDDNSCEVERWRMFHSPTAIGEAILHQILYPEVKHLVW